MKVRQNLSIVVKNENSTEHGKTQRIFMVQEVLPVEWFVLTRALAINSQALKISLSLPEPLSEVHEVKHYHGTLGRFVAHRHPGPLSPNHLAKFKRPRILSFVCTLYLLILQCCFCFFLHSFLFCLRARVQFWKILDQKQTIYFKRSYLKTLLPRPPLRNINVTQFKTKVSEWSCFAVCHGRKKFD